MVTNQPARPGDRSRWRCGASFTSMHGGAGTRLCSPACKQARQRAATSARACCSPPARRPSR